MKFCSDCGSTIRLEIPAGDQFNRHVCSQCETVFYQNPKIITGCIISHGDRILLCKRAIEPRYGLWTIPAGFLENGESVVAGAMRETYEEACAYTNDLALYGVYNLLRVNQVYMIFQGTMATAEHAAGAESLETGLYLESEIPWESLAFTVVGKSLKQYFADRKKGTFHPYMDDIEI